MINMARLPRVMTGQEATDFFNSFKYRNPVQQIKGFDVFEKRDQGDNSIVSRVVGYYAYYRPYAAKNRPAIFVQSRTLKELKARIDDARKQVGF